MKILISADMEGTTGFTTWDQVTPGHAEYERFRRRMTEDVNAAIRGAFAGGADSVTVTDGHWDGSNILVEELEAGAVLNSGSPSPHSMMQGIEDRVDGVLFVGYHARHGSEKAVLDHTWSSTCVQNIWLNGVPAGEYTLNAALAGHFGAAVLLATGDQTACAQIAQQIPTVETAVVKTATGRYSAECLAGNAAQDQIEQAARRGVERLARKEAPAVYVVAAPIQIEIEFKASDMADRASLFPGARRDGLKVSATAAHMVEAQATFRSLVSLSYPR